MKKLKGYILLEAIIYIVISVVVLGAVAMIISSALSVNVRVENEVKLSEIAAIAQDRIRQEFKSCVGITGVEYNKNKVVDGHTYVKCIEYNLSDFDNPELITKKKISIASDNIYIGAIGKYQIANYVKGLYIKNITNDEGLLRGVSFVVIFNNGSTSFIDKYTIMMNRNG